MSKCIARSCEQIIPDGRTVCTACGCDQSWARFDRYSLPDLIKCKACKSDVSLKAELCPNCGEPQAPKLIREQEPAKLENHPPSTQCPFCREANVWGKTECRRCGMRMYAAMILQDNEYNRVKLVRKAPKIGFVAGLIIGIIVPAVIINIYVGDISSRLNVSIWIGAVLLAIVGFTVGIFFPYLFGKLINPPFKSQLELEKDISGCELPYSQFGNPPQKS